MEAYRERDAMGREAMIVREPRGKCDNCGAIFDAASAGRECPDCDFEGLIRFDGQYAFGFEDELERARR
jgi:hypothetical protein